MKRGSTEKGVRLRRWSPGALATATDASTPNRAVDAHVRGRQVPAPSSRGWVENTATQSTLRPGTGRSVPDTPDTPPCCPSVSGIGDCFTPRTASIRTRTRLPGHASGARNCRKAFSPEHHRHQFRTSGEVGSRSQRTLPTSRPNRLDELRAEPHMTPPIVALAFTADPISACHKAIRDRWYRSAPQSAAAVEPPNVWPLLSLAEGTALQRRQLLTRSLGHIRPKPHQRHRGHRFRADRRHTEKVRDRLTRSPSPPLR
ncbi:hypothetical protein ABIE52_000090 [Rhodococcus sp. OAS809]